LLALCACGGESSTGLEIRVLTDPDAERPSYLVLDLLDGERLLLDGERVPRQGELSAGATPMATIRVTAPDGASGVRRVVVSGLNGAGVTVSQGLAVDELSPGAWRRVTVTLAPGRRPDSDGDGVPDAIDGCPQDRAVSGPCGGPPTSRPDSGGSITADGAAPPDPDGSPAPPPDGAAPPRDGATGGAPDAGVPPAVDATAVPPADGAAEAAVPPAADAAGADAAPADAPAAARDAAVDTPPDAAAAPSCGAVLVVVGRADSPVDQAVAGRLRTLGCTVTTKLDTAVVVGDATGKAVVVFTDTVRVWQAARTLQGTAGPLLTMRPALFDDLKMVANGEGTTWGRDGVTTSVTVAAEGHPAAGDQRGAVTILGRALPVGWGVPEPAAERIAVLPAAPNRAVLFSYEPGTTGPGGFVMPGRRVAYVVTENAVLDLNAAGWMLFDAAVRWAQHPR
jgi:hypothetical protein